MPAARAEDYFQFQAKLGFSKYYESLDAMLELAEMTRIKPDPLVLDLGCGVGATPRSLAKEFDLKIIGRILKHVLTDKGS